MLRKTTHKLSIREKFKFYNFTKDTGISNIYSINFSFPGVYKTFKIFPMPEKFGQRFGTAKCI